MVSCEIVGDQPRHRANPYRHRAVVAPERRGVQAAGGGSRPQRAEPEVIAGHRVGEEREVLAAYYDHSANTSPAETVPAVDLLLDGLVALGVLPAGIYELTFGDPQPGAIVDAPAQ